MLGGGVRSAGVGGDLLACGAFELLTSWHAERAACWTFAVASFVGGGELAGMRNVWIVGQLELRGGGIPCAAHRRIQDEYAMVFAVERPCRVSMRDEDGVEHTIELVAERVMLAAAAGYVALAREPWGEGVRGEIVVEVTTRHRVSLADLRAWLAKPGRVPQEITLRQEVQQVLEAGRDTARRRRSRESVR